MTNINVKIDSISCGGCVKNINDGISDKVEMVDVDIATKIANIKYDEDKISKEEILRYLDLLGYTGQIQ